MFAFQNAERESKKCVNAHAEFILCEIFSCFSFSWQTKSYCGCRLSCRWQFSQTQLSNIACTLGCTRVLGEWNTTPRVIADSSSNEYMAWEHLINTWTSWQMSFAVWLLSLSCQRMKGVLQQKHLDMPRLILMSVLSKKNLKVNGLRGSKATRRPTPSKKFIKEKPESWWEAVFMDVRSK